HGVSAVSQQRSTPVWICGRDPVGWDMDDLLVDPGGGSKDARALVPGEDVGGGDVEALADGPGVTQQGNETLGEVVAVRQRPQRRAVALHDDFLSLSHALHQSPAGVARHQSAVVGVRRPNDRRRKAVLAAGAYQPILTSDLVPRVLPVRITQRRRLGDRHSGWRSLVRRGRADEDVLADPSSESLEINFDVS